MWAAFRPSFLSSSTNLFFIFFPTTVKRQFSPLLHVKVLQKTLIFLCNQSTVQVSPSLLPPISHSDNVPAMNIAANLACHRERYSRLDVDPPVHPAMSPVWWRAPTTRCSSCPCSPGSVGPSTILHASSSVADVVPIPPRARLPHVLHRGPPPEHPRGRTRQRNGRVQVHL